MTIEKPGAGWQRMLVSAFPAYNTAATAAIFAQNHDTTMVQYTYSVPDTDGLYCWVREEDIYTRLMTPTQKNKIKSRDLATTMKVVTE